MKRTLLFLLCMVLLSISTFAQSRVLTGKVKDAKGETLPGVSVLIKGTSSGVATDLDGNFTLKVADGNILVFSFVGYKNQEITLGNQTVLNVVLVDDITQLNEVVVIGYGSVRKEDLTGSVIAIKAEEMNRGAITSPQQMLQGKVPGLLVQPGNGQPGSGATLRIRSGASLNASNDPLIVIDGVPVSNDAAPGMSNALATINPDDIETFTVLKDASATAIYGSRASNGVIIITTKKGIAASKNGGANKIKVSYASTYSLSDPHDRIKTLGGQEYREMLGKVFPTGTAIGDDAHALLNMYPDQSTDWQDQIFRTAFATDQNLSIAGSAANMPYRVSFGYNNEDGTLKTSNYERYTASISLSPKFFNEHLSIDLNVKGTINNNQFADDGAVGAAAFYDPTKPIYNETGRYNGFWNWEVGDAASRLSSTNPLSLLYDVRNDGKTKRSIGNIQVDYKMHFLPELRANLNVGYDVARGEGYNGPKIGSFQTAKDTDFPNIGQHTEWNNFRRNQLLDFYLNYAKEIEQIDSRLDVMVGYSWQHFYSSNHSKTLSNTDPSFVAGTTPLAPKDGWEQDETTGAYLKNGSRVVPTENYLVSFFGRLNYTFKNRYLVTATLRRDGSSRFSDDNRWGTFPSVAAAWTVSNESFMEATGGWLSSLKLRAGYGITGQQDLGMDYAYIPSYVFGSNPNSTYFGSSLLKAAAYNRNLKWEETKTSNIGIDFGFLNNRINGSIEYYFKKTDDLLNTVDVPAGTNFANRLTANVGSMENKGVEFNINAGVIQAENFTWNVGFNVTWNESKITKLTVTNNPDYEGISTGGVSTGTGGTIQKHMVGQTPYTFFVYQQVYGMDGKPIQNTVVDRNKDGQISEADRYLHHSPMPKVYGGFSSQFRYKNIDLGFNLRASFGNYVFNDFASGNSSANNAYGAQGFLTNLYEGIYDTGFTGTNNGSQVFSDLFVEDASFLKMDNITLGYSFDKLFTERLSGRISFAVQNVFTITDYSGLDPECSGIDSNIWPRPRVYTLGLNLNF